MYPEPTLDYIIIESSSTIFKIVSKFILNLQAVRPAARDLATVSRYLFTDSDWREL